MRQFNRTAIAVGVAQLCWMSAVFAQDTAPAAPAANSQVVTITGQRAALNSAQNIKRNSDEVVDSIVAEDIGKLPDKSITEVLQRVPGVTIDRTMSRSDPEHFSVEGSGVSIRGLTWVRSELNGRDSFSSTGGRALNFEDVPPELMAGVDVYKNPSAEQIEGGISGLVNLRTALPFAKRDPHRRVPGRPVLPERQRRTGPHRLAAARRRLPLGGIRPRAHRHLWRAAVEAG